MALNRYAKGGKASPYDDMLSHHLKNIGADDIAGIISADPHFANRFGVGAQPTATVPPPAQSSGLGDTLQQYDTPMGQAYMQTRDFLPYSHKNGGGIKHYAAGGSSQDFSKYVSTVPMSEMTGQGLSPYVAQVGKNGIPSGGSSQSGLSFPSSIGAQSSVPNPNPPPSAQSSSQSAAPTGPFYGNQGGGYNLLSSLNSSIPTYQKYQYSGPFYTMQNGNYTQLDTPPPGLFKMNTGGNVKMADGGTPPMSTMAPWYMRREASQEDAVHSGGLFPGATGGRSDVLNRLVPAGAYVIPSDVVSGLGEGNTNAGANVLDHMMHSLPYGIKGGSGRHGGMGVPRAPAAFKQSSPNLGNMVSRGGTPKGDEGHVPIVAASGEFLVTPEHVKALGGGDIKHGHRILDAFVVHVRKKTADTMKKLPGPKR